MRNIGEYKIIYADPPWNYDDQGCRGTMAHHYSGMSVDDIKALPVRNLAADDAVLFIWVTYPFLREGLDVIEAWGFKYKTIAFQWVKTYPSGSDFFGLGRWTRGNTEPCLLGVKGKPKRCDSGISQIIRSRVREHSRKPDVVREKIVQLMGNYPRVELFARQRFEGWDVWGDEAPTKTQCRLDDRTQVPEKRTNTLTPFEGKL